MSELVIKAKQLTREFIRREKPFNAVENVNLEIAPHDLVAIVGRSGNGKTTLLNLLTGLLKPTSGEVRVAGQNLAELGDRQLSELRNRTMGICTQSQSLLASLNALDNAILPATLYSKASSETAFTRALELFEALEIKHLTEAYPNELSGGEMRRVAIARALVNHPQVFIADEPTGDLDAQSTELVMRLLAGLPEAGTAVVFATHDPQALETARTVYEINAGVLSEVPPN
ncbi:ABC transporter ATP-binding protein [Mobiluncus mulieris]|uniref:ABC transporter ATP-binding protein n=1 Tax=Mobiluncus mulieris TaxID=2052 RepID=UPI00242F027E|nr:ATP-binding cassette domain-containing protein [Mobiluncus mulieris]